MKLFRIFSAICLGIVFIIPIIFCMIAAAIGIIMAGIVLIILPESEDVRFGGSKKFDTKKWSAGYNEW